MKKFNEEERCRVYFEDRWIDAFYYNCCDITKRHFVKMKVSELNSINSKAHFHIEGFTDNQILHVS